MARYIDAIDLVIPIEEAFDYLADFSRTAEWDPCVAEARRLTRGKVRLGSRFGVTVSVLGRRVALEYRIAEFERPSHLVLSGGAPSLRSVDEISFVARPGGTRVTYDARLELVGIRRIADPLLDLLLQRIGSLAMRGLRERLAGAGSRAGYDQNSSKRRHEPARRSGTRAKTRGEARSDQQTKEGVAG